jgi:hypothetical protein
VLAAALAAGGCGRGDDEASIEDRLAETGSMDVLEQAGEAEYDPPADGELTEDQVEMYLAVQERAWKIRQVAAKKVEEKTRDAEGQDKQVGFLDAMRSLGDVGDFVTAELRAAQELGHNPAEYQWVQGKVLEAQMARATAGMREQMAGVGNQVVEMLEAQREAATDEETRRQLDEQIAEARKNFADAQQEDPDAWEPGVEHNVELVARYDEKLEELQQRIAESS